MEIDILVVMNNLTNDFICICHYVKNFAVFAT